MLGQLFNKTYDYELYICDFKKKQIACIDYTDIEYTPRFNNYDELNFTVEYYQNNILMIKNESFDMKAAYIIQMDIKEGDTVIQTEYFSIDDPNAQLDSNGIIKKSIHCFSYPYTIFSMRKLRGYKNEVRTLYDPNNAYSYSDNTKGGILNYIFLQLYNTFSVGYINPKFLGVYHTFTFVENTLTDVLTQLEKDFNCIILIDSVNNQLNIYDPSELGENKGLVISKDVYLKSLSTSNQLTDLVTRLYVTGKDSATIAKYNPTGMLYVEDYSYFLNHGYFSSSLTTAMNNYNTLVANSTSVFTEYLNSLDTYNASLLTLNNTLISQKIDLAVIQDSLNAEINANHSTTPNYSIIMAQYMAKQAEIDATQNSINTINDQIASVNASITNLRNTLKYENNFTQDQLAELSYFIYEGTLQLSSCSDEKQLYDYAVAYLQEKSQLPISLQIDMVDIFNDHEAQLDWDKVNIGDFVNVDISELGYDYTPLRIESYSHNKTSNTLTITLSNTNELNTDLQNLSSIFKLASNVATKTSVLEDSYSQYTNDKDNILTRDSILDNQISLGSITVNQRGFVGTDIGGQTNSALKILGDKIVISTDNFTTFHTLLSGSGLLLESNNKKTRIVIHPEYGFQIDKNVGTTASPIWTNQLYQDTNGNLVAQGNISARNIVASDGTNKVTIDSNGQISLSSTIMAIVQPYGAIGIFPSTLTMKTMIVQACDDSNTYTPINGYLTLGKTKQSQVEVPGSGGTTIYPTGIIDLGYLTVIGSKNSLQKTETYGDRLINAYETADYYFGDIGSGIIGDDGEVVIHIDEILQECVNTNITYHVFTQVYNGSISTIERHPNYFIVKGVAGTNFSWELKAKRLGYEFNRLEVFNPDDEVIYSNIESELNYNQTLENQLLEG